jgi:peptidyl-prolyl cis-trans isomerase C
MHRGQMVVTFERSAYAMDREGQISEPVKTEYGYHIIRLNKRYGNTVSEYDEVKSAAIDRVKQAYLENYSQNYLRKMLQDPIVIPDGAVEIMAKRHFGEELELAPVFEK